MRRFLFLLKHRDASWGVYSDEGYKLPSGLRNSVYYIVLMLNLLGFEAKAVEVHDANDIDREVTLYRPDEAIVEALWVLPSKFAELKKLWRHRNVHWAVRSHSEAPFAALETWAMTWIAGYLCEGVEVSCNSPRAQRDLRGLGIAAPELIGYTPNWYPIFDTRPQDSEPHPPRGDDVIRISSFGAIRPLKNQLIQLMAAIAFARKIRKQLHFYVNSTRVEMNANPVLKNLRATADAADVRLVEVPWLDTPQFLMLLSEIDIAMQCSFSETFNICSADAANQNTPIVCSPEVPWIGSYAWCDPNDSSDIVRALTEIYQDRNLQRRLQHQRQDLRTYSRQSERVWYNRYAR